MEENKHVEYEDDFHELIVVTFTSVWSKERLSRKDLPKEFHARWNVEMTALAPFEQDEKGIHAKMKPKAHGRSLQNMWYDRRNVSQRIRVCRENYILFLLASLATFFSLISAHPSRSIFHSFVRTRTRVFTANISKKRLHVTTTRRWIQKV